MKTLGHGRSHEGRQRTNNEDALLVDDDLGLYVVCDGVGGHAAGEAASRLAISACHSKIRANTDTIRRARAGDGQHADLRRIAREAVSAACQEVYGNATSKPELSGMACTITLLLVAGKRGVMVHVGDTRLYLCRDGAAWQLSSDHTLAADLVRRGDLTPEQMGSHPYASALTRAVGGQGAVEPDTLILDVLPDDLFLICSDGLSVYFDGLAEVCALLTGSPPDQLPEKLIALANERGGKDNVTAIVVRAVASDDEERELTALASDLRERDRALEAVPFLKGLRFADRLRILEITELRRLGPGEALFVVGDELHALYVPFRGSLELTTSDGVTTRVAEKACVGATSLLVKRRSWASLRATQDSAVLVVDGPGFQALARRRPWLGVALMSELARELGTELAAAGEKIVESAPRPSWWSPRRWI